MLEDSLLKHYPKEIRLTQERINGYEADIALYERYKSEDFPGMLLYGTHYAEKKEAGTAILEACKEVNAKWVVVEQDQPSMGKTPLECAETSIKYLKSIF